MGHILLNRSYIILFFQINIHVPTFEHEELCTDKIKNTKQLNISKALPVRQIFQLII